MNSIEHGVRTVNPATYEEMEYYPYTTEAELHEIIASAASAQRRSKDKTPEDRIKGIINLASALKAEKTTFARQIVQEMGKPINQALKEIEKCIDACEYYAENLEAFLEPRKINVKPHLAEVHLRPLGVILAIMPWNYPWWQVIRAVLPAIAAGNTAILKHADSVTGCAFTVQRIFQHAFDDDVLHTVVLPGHRVREVIEHPHIAAIAFTGSEQIGAKVAATAGEVLKKCVLELGGSDPLIILGDADVQMAAEAAVMSRFLNNGQSCIAAKRLVVERSIYPEILEAIRANVSRLRVGDPLDSSTDIGPLARRDLLEKLSTQRGRSLKAGGKQIATATAPETLGAWFAPTILEVNNRRNPILVEETFGPLGALTVVEDYEQAISVANDTEYGLSSSIWSQDIERAQQIAANLNVGSAFINTISISDPRLPVGGVKASGYGRELADYGIAEFSNIQTVRTAQH